MSRTYRKSYLNATNKELYSKHNWRRGYLFNFEITREYIASNSSLDKLKRKYGTCGVRPLAYSDKHTHVVLYYSIKDNEQVYLEDTLEYERSTRDGRVKESTQNKGFKRVAAKTVRRKTKEFLNYYTKNHEEPDEPYPDTYLGKSHVWDFW